MIEASPEDVKKYRAYLTRLTKWVAVRDQHEKTSQVGVMAVRNALVGMGELRSYLDDGWEKRVFSDDGLFTPDGDGFYKVLVVEDDPDDAPPRPSPWEGVRPGEDVIGDSFKNAVTSVERLSFPNWKSRWLRSDPWPQVHIAMEQALSYARSRGWDRPLAPLQEHAFKVALTTSEVAVQTVALWLTDTLRLIEAFARVRAFAKSQGELLFPGELMLYYPDTGAGEEGVTPMMALREIQGALIERGVMKKK